MAEEQTQPTPRKPFWRGVFSEQDGTPSFTRVCSGIFAGFACGWVTASLYMTHALPATTTLMGLAAFVASPYTVNKASGTLVDIFGVKAS